MSIVLRFFPNGEFVQGNNSAKQRRDKRKHPLGGINERRDDEGRVSTHFENRNAEIPQETLNFFLGRRYRSPSEHLYKVVEAGQNSVVLEWRSDNGVSYYASIQLNILRVIHDWKLTDIGLSDARILTQPQESRKQCLSMTKNMARNLRNAVYLLETRYGKDTLSFLTLTLPNLSPDGLASCCERWDTMIHNFIKWLRTKVERGLCELEYAYCTEIQPNRLSQRGEYAPHLHIVFRGRVDRRSAWFVTPQQVRAEWSNQVKSCTAEHFTSSALENLQRVKKSAQRYLSKYIGKGSIVDAGGVKIRSVARLRTHWGGMSRNLSRQIKRKLIRIEGTGERGTLEGSFLGSMSHLVKTGVVKFWKSGLIPIAGTGSGSGERFLKVGVGCLRKPPDRGGLVDCMKAIESFYKDSVDDELLQPLDSFLNN